MTRFTRNGFNLESKQSIGVEFSTRKASINSHQIQVQVWDIPGIVKQNSVLKQYYEGALGAFFIYDTTRRSTFEYLNELQQEFDQFNQDFAPQVMIIGNKFDLTNLRNVDDYDIELFCKIHGYQHQFVSALDNLNLELVFQLLLKSHDILFRYSIKPKSELLKAFQFKIIKIG